MKLFGFRFSRTRMFIILTLLVVWLNPFDLGLWINKLFGDKIHMILFITALILLFFIMPQKTFNGKKRYLKKRFWQ